MRVLVTGGSGFLGKRVVPRLLSQGHDVVALARSPEASGVLSSLGAVPVRGDLDDEFVTHQVFRDSEAEVLVNLASLGFGHAERIVEAATDAHIRRAIFVSTTAVFTKLDARSKSVRLRAEESITASELDWTILRPTMIYGGADDRNMARLLGLLRRWRFIPVPGGGSSLQQPVHVEDLAQAIVTSLDRPGSIRRSYELAGPAPLPLREVIRQAGAAVGVWPVLLPVPLGLAVALLKAVESGSRRPLRIRAEQLERLREDKAFDIAAASIDLDFAPRSFVDGIRTEADYLGS